MMEDLKAQVLEFAQGFAETTGLDVTAEVTRDEPEGVLIGFQGTDAKQLIGRGGQVLDALQLIAINSIMGQGRGRLRVTFDADGYRLRREKMLTDMANELADQVASTGQEAVLDPLPPLERRIVHQILTERTDIQTYSEGEEPNRYIVIAPRQ
ncbi:R3H domain-containing nucleic acid-binding protein [Armatimonas sp.]|uniref:Jag family protein n=1 Tax=Armatimonas sp. TaxID=1872638 RepID=UPI00286BD21E|nr:R3H domain-containing nucleic acid-binding protein [Armatimonas sp.]